MLPVTLPNGKIQVVKTVTLPCPGHPDFLLSFPVSEHSAMSRYYFSTISTHGSKTYKETESNRRFFQTPEEYAMFTFRNAKQSRTFLASSAVQNWKAQYERIREDPVGFLVEHKSTSRSFCLIDRDTGEEWYRTIGQANPYGF
ncbi:hypothetical protein OAM67_00765 [bacterium]|nr:hypothetical protein [bacterium]